ncbi:hypothetical protein [Haladaptatus cibarius]|uniref:hypothetical protein n=1 Tax=Haladaptatus cibarius TaxID=453847 RepID=UPI000678CC26|nr:hypothetical protein [Haladaptatus cibarius]
MFPSLLSTAFGGVFVLFFLFAIGAPLVLWMLIESEGDREQAQHSDWENAERSARRDTRDEHIQSLFANSLISEATIEEKIFSMARVVG